MKKYRIEENNDSYVIVDIENKVNHVIKSKIFDMELFDYRIVEREELIDDLIRWISECTNSDKQLMKDDLKLLIMMKDDFIFSSITTNHYINSENQEFNNTCEYLIEINKKK